MLQMHAQLLRTPTALLHLHAENRDRPKQTPSLTSGFRHRGIIQNKTLELSARSIGTSLQTLDFSGYQVALDFSLLSFASAF